ncbi:anti-sigma regulatory factor [Mangrovicoccus algicola]|uniref:Anti-sigma regulatory factor n=1 Tax=Mangrovicoccus algicola TaxID=2771008 RepID=A0A8J6Z8G2_9RHOB|nr:anti-sigma regulatory factor [Mangrovicoccus algicola]MBE3639834.1 anti-sigma regulatory factor [Mangrovicoccus algicola]
MSPPVLPAEQVLRIARDGDIVAARQAGRLMASEIGFSRPEQALIATAISELTRNIVSYAGTGRLSCRAVQQPRRIGLRIIAEDQGPGIPDLEAALRDGYSTGNSLGLGLPGTRRIMDDFDIRSAPGQGVTVTVTKWTSC